MSYGWAAETSNVSEISTREFSKGVYTPQEKLTRRNFSAS